MELVHHGDGAVQGAGVFDGEADHPRIDQWHLAISQASGLEDGQQVLVQQALLVAAVARTDGIAQQAARGYPSEQLQRRLAEEGVGVDQHCQRVLLQHLAQQHMLAAKVITVRRVPCLACGFVQQVHGDRQTGIGLRVVGVNLNVHGFARAQMGEGADDAEAGFLMVGCRAKSQVDELGTQWLRGCMAGKTCLTGK